MLNKMFWAGGVCFVLAAGVHFYLRSQGYEQTLLPSASCCCCVPASDEAAPIAYPELATPAVMDEAVEPIVLDELRHAESEALIAGETIGEPGNGASALTTSPRPGGGPSLRMPYADESDPLHLGELLRPIERLLAALKR